jgi:transposase
MKNNQETVITTVYVLIDTLCKRFLETPAQKQKLTDGEVITIAICSALFFNSNHEKAKEKFFGFRLHLIVDTDGIPVSIAIMPGAYHDLTPLYEITSPLPQNSTVIGDKAFNCESDEKALKEFGVTLMPKRRKNMKKQWSLFQERFIIAQHRRQIETSFSILSNIMGHNRVKATTLAGFMLKTYAAVLAMIFYLAF